MKDKHEVIATRVIEPDLDLYDTFFDHAWAVALSERVPKQLRAAVGNLCLSWKEAANTHRLPWLMIVRARRNTLLGASLGSPLIARDQQVRVS